MILMHEVQGLATPALIVHRAQIVWIHLILISNVLPPKHVLSSSIRWPTTTAGSLQTCIRNKIDM